MAKGITKKPCHGCGEAKHRPIDALCGTCRTELDEARAIRKAMEENTELEQYRMPWTYYSLPYIPNLGPGDRDIKNDFQKAIRELITRVGVPKDSRKWHKPETKHVIDGTKDDDGTIYLKADVRELLNTIYHAALKMVKSSHARGKAEGRSFITQLAAGEVTIDVFNKAAIDGE